MAAGAGTADWEDIVLAHAEDEGGGVEVFVMVGYYFRGCFVPCVEFCGLGR